MQCETILPQLAHLCVIPTFTDYLLSDSVIMFYFRSLFISFSAFSLQRSGSWVYQHSRVHFDFWDL